MSTTAGRTARRTPQRTPIAAIVSRAVLTALLAVVVTFDTEHRPEQRVVFGIVVLGVFLVAQALLTAGWAARLAATRAGLVLLLARAAVSLVGGVVLLLSPAGGIDVLRPVEILVFLIVGVLEVAGGVLRTGGPDTAGDAVVIGGLQVVVGLMVVILNADVAFSVGVLSAWAALTTVYLGISAATLRAKRRRG